MSNPTPPVTEETLIGLLRAKDDAQAAYSAAWQAAREEGLAPEQRVRRDMDKVLTMRASSAADYAYDAALRAYAAQSEAA